MESAGIAMIKLEEFSDDELLIYAQSFYRVGQFLEIAGIHDKRVSGVYYVLRQEIAEREEKK